MSELDRKTTIATTGGTQLQTNDTPKITGVIADAVKIHAPIDGDRNTYRRAMELFNIQIKEAIRTGNTPLNPNNIIGAAEHRNDPMIKLKTDASILNSKVGIKDYPDGSFIGVFNSGVQMVVSGQLESPKSDQNELTPGTTQLAQPQNGLTTTEENQLEAVNTVTGIMISNQEPTQIPEPDHDAQLANNPYLLKKAA